MGRHERVRVIFNVSQNICYTFVYRINFETNQQNMQKNHPELFYGAVVGLCHSNE